MNYSELCYVRLNAIGKKLANMCGRCGATIMISDILLLQVRKSVATNEKKCCYE